MRVLFLTHRVPYAPNRGDRIRAFHIVRTLVRHFDVDIVSLAHSAEELSHVEDMRREGLSVEACSVHALTNYAKAIPTLIGPRPLTHSLLDAPGMRPLLQRLVDTRPPDVVLAFCSGMARFALEPPLNRRPCVVDLVDVDSVKWDDLARSAGVPLRWIYRREANRLVGFERTIADTARAVAVVNAREARLLEGIAPQLPARVVPNGIDLEAFRPIAQPTTEPRLVFCGVMNYAPNVEGVLWFAREVWPLVRKKEPRASFSIVGSDPTAAVKALAGAHSGIEVTGTVPRVQDHLSTAAISVAPLLVARGLQNKVLEALASGLPTVVTRAVADGLPAHALAGCRVAADAREFADATSALLDLAPPARRAFAARADLASLSWAEQLKALPEILREAARGGEPRGLAR